MMIVNKERIDNVQLKLANETTEEVVKLQIPRLLDQRKYELQSKNKSSTYVS